MPMRLGEFLRPVQCGVDRRYADKTACLADLARRAGLVLGLEASPILEALQHREALGSTGLGSGIALPHARIAGITEPYLAVTRLCDGIAFEAIDERPVDIVCLILLPAAGRPANDILACAVKRLRDKAVLTAVHRAKDAQALHHALTECDTA